MDLISNNLRSIEPVIDKLNLLLRYLSRRPHSTTYSLVFHRAIRFISLSIDRVPISSFYSFFLRSTARFIDLVMQSYSRRELSA